MNIMNIEGKLNKKIMKKIKLFKLEELSNGIIRLQS
jgi:hypothetical protein